MNTNREQKFFKHENYFRLFILDGYQRPCPIAMVLVDLSVGIQYGKPAIRWDVAFPAGGHADGGGGVFPIPNEVIRDYDINQFMVWLKRTLCVGCTDVTDFNKVRGNVYLRKIFARNSKVKIEQDKKSSSGKTRLASFLMVYNEQLRTPYDYALIDLSYAFADGNPVVCWDATFLTSNEDDSEGGHFSVPEHIIRKNSIDHFIDWLKKTLPPGCAELVDWETILADTQLKKWLDKLAK